MSSRPSQVVFLDAGTLPCGLALAGDRVDYRAFESTDASQLEARLAEADVVITNKVRLPAEQLRRAGRLKLICVAAAGTDNVDLLAAQELGIPVRNVPDYGSDSVAEHVIATLFALRRELPTYLIAARDGRWGQ